jgi:sec-independent protein translocase protein TatA
MLPNVGWPELLVILLVALLIFGPQRLAGVGAAMGKTIREFRNAMRDVEEPPNASPRRPAGPD